MTQAHAIFSDLSITTIKNVMCFFLSTNNFDYCRIARKSKRLNMTAFQSITNWKVFSSVPKNQ